MNKNKSQAFLQVRKHSEHLCEPLEIEDYVVQPSDEVSPPKWHLGHTTWFFEELILVQYAPNYQRFDEGYRRLFNSYYKAAGEHWLQSERGQLSRPTVREIYQYRDYVDRSLVEFLQRIEAEPHPQKEEITKLLTLGLHHEQQHQELLLMDIKSILAVNPSLPAYLDHPLPPAPEPSPTWTHIEAGVHEIGFSGDGFAYDNEQPRHRVYVPACELRNTLVSNGEFLAFIEDGGYSKPELWLSAGWDWVNTNKVTQPLYWYREHDTWCEYTLHGAAELDRHAPVAHVSYFEADAYAKWAGYRLPTEPELELQLILRPDVAALASHPSPSNVLRGNTFHASDAGAGQQLWCWSSSHYSPYPGFKPFDGFIQEYNGKFMCEQFVLRGGCIATPKDHFRPTYRNFYKAHQRWMFSGIKLARDIA